MIEELVILPKIIFITLILTADNAVIVGSIAANFVPKNRKQIILWGVIGAFVFKIFFAIFATYLFKFYFVKILGGILLIWIVNDLRKDLLRQGLQLPLEGVGLSKNLRLAIWTTTPWTLPANVAVSVNKNLSYVFAKDEGIALYIECKSK